MYTVEKKLSGTDIPYDDGIHITYANAEVKDGTEIARAMQYLKNRILWTRAMGPYRREFII